MTETTSPALRTALAYFHAWTSHDLDKAMEYIAENIVCDAPAGRLEGREAYLGFMRPFVQILTGSELLAAFGDEKTAVVVYDTATVPVASAPATKSSSLATSTSAPWPVTMPVRRSNVSHSPGTDDSSTAGEYLATLRTAKPIRATL